MHDEECHWNVFKLKLIWCCQDLSVWTFSLMTYHLLHWPNITNRVESSCITLSNTRQFYSSREWLSVWELGKGLTGPICLTLFPFPPRPAKIGPFVILLCLKPLFQSSQKLVRSSLQVLASKKNSQRANRHCEFFLIRYKHLQRAANQFLRWLEKRL